MYDLENLDFENTCFHFTPTRNLESIAEEGLIPQIGENAKGAEKSFKVFFSKGQKGILELANVWIQWTIYRMYASDVVSKLGGQRQMNDEFAIARKDIKAGTIPNYEEYKEAAIQKMIREYSNCTYLSLDIKDGIDYRSDDVDEIKQKEKDRDFLETMYFKPCPEGDTTMESWNMHTISGKKINVDKLAIVCSQGKIDALSVIKKAYELSKTEDMQLPFLDELINKVTEKRSL